MATLGLGLALLKEAEQTSPTFGGVLVLCGIVSLVGLLRRQ
jgi:hypothetical protein